jgi:hypothetical protein
MADDRSGNRKTAREFSHRVFILVGYPALTGRDLTMELTPTRGRLDHAQRLIFTLGQFSVNDEATEVRRRLPIT